MQTNIEVTNLVSDYGDNTRRPDRVAFASGFTPRTLNRSYEEAKANARLIAAAPELYEAAVKLERVVRLGIPRAAMQRIHDYGLWEEFCSARIHIEEAIAKAEGRE